MSNPLVYIVDDDPVVTQVIERRFSVFGCEARSFSNGKDLLNAYDAKEPKLMVIDLNLGDGLSGFDLIRILRSEKQAPCPLIILSGETDREKISHAIELGADDFLVKPFLKLDFEEVIGKYLRASNLVEAGEGKFQTVKPARRAVQCSLKLQIEEVNPAGLILRSEHLIKKGSTITLKGPELTKLLPGISELRTRVVNSSSLNTNSKIYQISVEIESSQEKAIEELKIFLSKKLAEAKVQSF